MNYFHVLIFMWARSCTFSMLIVDGQQKRGKSFFLSLENLPQFLNQTQTHLNFNFILINRKNLGASTISSALNAHAGNVNGNVSIWTKKYLRVFFHVCATSALCSLSSSSHSLTFKLKKSSLIFPCSHCTNWTLLPSFTFCA